MTKWKSKKHMHRKERGSSTSTQIENPQHIPLFENIYEGMQFRFLIKNQE